MKNDTANRLGWKNSLAAAAIVVTLAVLGILRLEASYPEVSPIDLELDGPGENVDDPCFWVNPSDPSSSLIFSTTKNSGLVEVFNLIDGTFVATIPGFVRPNNCDVFGDVLVTTDRDGGDVKLHHIPDLTLLGTLGEDLLRPYGVDVAEMANGDVLVYVTEETDASVHVYDLNTGALVRTFPTGFGGGIEPILVDTRHQRVFVCRGENETVRGIGVYTLEGAALGEFGAQVFAGQAEGMAIYACGDEGYLIVSDQRVSVSEFEIFDRVTLNHLGTFRLQDGSGDLTNATDGIDVLQVPLPGFPDGVFAACDGCGDSLPDEMDVVSWGRIAAVMGLDICPEGLPSDCLTTPCTQRVIGSADAFVSSAAPDTNFGTAEKVEVELDQTNESRGLLRFEVPDFTGFAVLNATLRLTVEGANSSGSDSGGSLFLSTGGWAEGQVTFDTQPVAIGDVIDSVGPVESQDAVDFNVSDVIEGEGTYDFLLLSDSADKVRYYSRDAQKNPPTLLLTVRRSNPPDVVITSPSDGVVVTPGAPLLLAGIAADDEDGNLSFAIVWRSNLDGLLGQGPSLTISSLSAGVHSITAEVFDTTGLRATKTVTAIINTSPSVIISAPADGSQFEPGDPVSFEAIANDAEDGNLTPAISWTSDLHGELGTGGSLTITSLGSGAHTVTAAVTDAMGVGGSYRVSLIINATPEVTLLAPANGAMFEPGEIVELIAAAADAEDGDLGPSIAWASDRDGPLGMGSHVATTALVSSGAHFVTASVVDSGGRTAVGAVTVSIDAVPAVDVTAPANGSGYEPGEAVVLSGTASDLEDGDLAGEIRWTSDLDGALGTGGSLAVTALSSGTHTLTAAVEDSGGKRASAAITAVVNATPTVAITAPLDGVLVFTDALPLLLSGTAADLEDGDLTGRLVWTSDRDGLLGTGVGVPAMLSPGLHLISATVTDAGGRTARVQVSVDVREPNALPEIEIAEPRDGTEVPAGTALTLVAIAVDKEDGDISGAIEWVSDRDGLIGAGAVLTVVLGEGSHVVTARVADSGGAVASVQITVTITPTPPEVTILAPVDGSLVHGGQMLTLAGTALDATDGDLSGELMWTSDRDGALGTGPTVEAIGLTPGTHIVTARVTDTGGLDAQAMIRLVVNAMPNLTVIMPASGATLLAGKPVLLRAEATDAEDGDLGEHIAWTSDRDGQLGVGSLVMVAGFSEGQHTIMAAVRDSDDAVANAQVHLSVRSATLTILAEADTYVDASLPDDAFGADEIFRVDQSPVREAFLRFMVANVAPFAIEDATLRLTVGPLSSHAGPAGTVHSITADTWSEETTTFSSRPMIDGPALATHGDVVSDAVVEFDLSTAVVGEGVYNLAIVTTSGNAVGYRTREATTGQPQLVLHLTQNTAPAVTITAPPAASQIVAGVPVVLLGAASDAEDGDLSQQIVWSSDRDGELGSGPSVTATLTPGPHTIAATVTDGDGLSDVAETTIYVASPPTVSITMPADGVVLVRDELPIVVSGTATDVEDGRLDGQLEWTSDRDGLLGTGAAITVSQLSLGQHTLMASVTDSDGLLGTADIAVRVRLPNIGPNVTITGPADGSTVAAGTIVEFAATAIDDFDGDLSMRIAWSSEVDGTLGVGAGVAVVLSEGSHSVTASVTDSDGVIGTSQISVLVLPTPPTVTIETPGDGAMVAAGNIVTFSGRATDATDGDVSAALTWVSDRDGLLGTGATFGTAVLSIGLHTVVATASDSGGLTGSAQITLMANGPPTVTVEAPANGARLLSGQPVILAATATDPEDGDLSGGITWTSDLDGDLGTGTPITVAGLSVGSHTLTARVADRGGTAAGAVVTVSVEPATLTVPAAADTYVDAGTPDTPLGAEDIMRTDASPERQTFIRFEVPDLAVFSVEQALLRLTVGPTANHASVTGGSVHSISDTTWSEDTMTFATRASVDGPMLATQGPVASGDVVDFDVTTAVLGAGPRSFAILTDSADAVGYRSREATSGGPLLVITLHQNQAPFVQITAPPSGSTVIAGNTVALTAAASDPEDGDMSHAVVWRSDVEGDLGTGASVTVVPRTGLHTITAEVTDSGGLRGRAAIVVSVDSPPTVTIVNPTDGEMFEPGAHIALTASAADAEDGDLAQSVTWTSDRDGMLGTGSALVVDGLSAGIHVIRASTVDGAGSVGSDTVTVVVNGLPAVMIVAPADGTTFAAGSPVMLMGKAEDAEDGDLKTALAWSSDRDGLLGNGEALTVVLSPGMHVVTASVSDALGAAGIASVTLMMMDEPPTVTIVTPGEGTVITEGEAVLLSGQAVDRVDGDLSGTLSWTSNLQGLLGNGPALAMTTLQVGQHEVTASAMDSGGQVGTATVRVTVAARSTMRFGAVADAFVVETAPESRFGGGSNLIVKDASPVMETFLRFEVQGTAGLSPTRATVQLTLDTSPSAGSSSGGEIRAISDTEWDELLLTYSSRPPIDGPTLDTVGPVSPGEVVAFDVTAAVNGDGTYVFALLGTVADSVVYRSREAAVGNPQLVLLAEADPSNAQPAVVVVSPVDGALVTQGAAVTLGAAAADAEDGDMAGAVSWASDRDGVLGTGGELLVDGLSPGIHVITASVVDSAGSGASDTVTVVVNGVPEVAILAPANGTTIPVGEAVVLTGGAQDAEDGNLGMALVWRSDRDGLLGTGEGLTVVLSPGIHVVTASVSDALGITGAASVTVMVTDAAPVVNILAPGEGTVITAGEAVLLSGQAVDGVDGDLSENLMWASSVDGPLGSGPVLTVSTLQAGMHEITASAVDSSGQVGAATVHVSVTASSTMTFETVADAFVVETAPESRFGGGSNLIVNGSNPAMQAFLRFEVQGTAGLSPTHATVELRVNASPSAGSSSGGEMHAISDTEWDELQLTYSMRPPIDGPVLDTVGPVSPGEVVDFDVTVAVNGDGTYVFALLGTVADSVVYQSREAGVDGPRLVLRTGGSTSNAPPEVVILSPFDGAVVPANAPVTFEAVATDAEDGDLSAVVVWSSDIDGMLGTGSVLEFGSLTAGAHRIRAEAVDSGGRSGVMEMLLVVNAGPDVTILAPVEGMTIEAGTSVVLTGTATDAADGDLSVAIIWSSDRQGRLGSGPSLSTALFGFGPHVLTAEVTNSAGASGAASVTVAVTGTATFDVVADAAVMDDQPDVNFGASDRLTVDGSPVRRAYLRFVVTGLEGGIVTDATVFLTVDSGSTAGGPSGGDIIPIANSSWREDTVTFSTSPSVSGPLVASAGEVTPGQVVGLDVSSVVAGNGTYDFALVGASSNKVEYVAREAGGGGPRLVVTLE